MELYAIKEHGKIYVVKLESSEWSEKKKKTKSKCHNIVFRFFKCLSKEVNGKIQQYILKKRNIMAR